LRGVLVDTYALLAAATGDLTPAARSVFSEIRKGREKARFLCSKMRMSYLNI
jgi:hypothetical protein